MVLSVSFPEPLLGGALLLSRKTDIILAMSFLPVHVLSLFVFVWCVCVCAHTCVRARTQIEDRLLFVLDKH